MESQFSFIGTIPPSKSLINRYLIAKSYFPNLNIENRSECDDAVLMEKGIRDMMAGKPVDCGHAGTVLRFLALRAARLRGTHKLTGSKRLFARPQSELLPILRQLGATAELQDDSLLIESQGWNLVVDGLYISGARSSQFASAVALNAWMLPFDLHFQIESKMASAGYWRMTLESLRKLGMTILENGREYTVPKNQNVSVESMSVEPDMSSAFAVAALGAVAGESVIRMFPAESLQPDVKFASILEKMGVPVWRRGSDFGVKKALQLRGIEVDILDAPDLFPVLGVLSALAGSPTTVRGTDVLEYKESPRLSKTAELLWAMGARLEDLSGAVKIIPVETSPKTKFEFDVADDHRLVMAGAVARAAGFPVHVNNAAAVTKSFPEFLKIAGGFL